jgi:hypothetical protein
MLKWIKQKGLASPEHLKETETAATAAIDEDQVAKEIFEQWDEKDTGRITVEDLSE